MPDSSPDRLEVPPVGEVFDAQTSPADPARTPKPAREPVFAAIVSKGEPRRPIVPAVLRRGNLKPTVKNVTGRVAHKSAYHLARLPLWYLPLALFWSAAGVFKLAGRQITWWWVLEQHHLRQQAATDNDGIMWLRLHREAKVTRAWRGSVLLVEVVFLTVVVVALVFVAPWWVDVVLLLVVVVPTLAHFGRPDEHPIVTPAVVSAKYRKLTLELVRAAVMACRIPGVKDPSDVELVHDIAVDGPGQMAIVDLPGGIDAAEVIERRSKLASALRIPVDQVWPEPMPKAHPGRLALWVGYEPASEMRQPPWPLVKGDDKPTDVFKPFPFGTDPRLRKVDGALMYRNWLIGAMPGAGKTSALRLPLLFAALDPRVELRLFELKGTGDLDPLESLCTEFGSGADDDTAAAALDMLRDLFAECIRRGPIIKRMAKAGKAPDNKITPLLAAMPGLDLRPLVAAIDECQMLFAHSEYGKEAGELAEKIIKLGRALGIVLLLATQRPDAKSLPKGVSDNAGMRFCLRVMGHEANDMILGTGRHKQGIRATIFGDDDIGWGWLVGLNKPEVVHTYYVNKPDADRVVARALRIRQAAGVLPADHEPQVRVPAYNLLEDVAAVWPSGEDKMWSETVIALLSELRPEVYVGWTADQLAKALKPYGISTVQVWGTDPTTGEGANRRGIEYAHLRAAITERTKGQITGSPANSGV
jgi:S-DNA-T family DNA segregation ATPase FtsK/SpoIIIE